MTKEQADQIEDDANTKPAVSYAEKAGLSGEDRSLERKAEDDWNNADTWGDDKAKERAQAELDRLDAIETKRRRSATEQAEARLPGSAASATKKGIE